MLEKKGFDFKVNEILDGAEKLFTTKGYDLTTVNNILAEVGIAKGTFYHYFKSKEDVMDGVIMRIINEELKYVSEILARKDLSSLEKLVIALFKKPSSDSKTVIVERLYDAENALMKQRAMQRTLELICPIYAEIITEGNQTKLFSAENPLADSQFLIAGIQTIYDLSRLKNSEIQVNFEAVLNAMYQILNIDERKVTKEQLKKMVT